MSAFLRMGSRPANLRHHGPRLLLCAVGLWAWPAAALEPQPLSLPEAQSRAVEYSRQLGARQSAVEAAREMAVAAGERPDPTLTLAVTNLPSDGPDRYSTTRDFMTMRSVGVMQEFTRGEKLKARAARFDREAEAAEASRDLALSKLQRATATAWLDRYHQERMRELLVSQRDAAELQVRAADAAYRGGRGSQADAFSARAALAQIDDRIAQAERQIATARTQLARWIGAAANQPLANPPAMDRVGFTPAELEARLAHHPEVAAMLKQEEMARADVEVARVNRSADWTGELMYSRRGPAYSNMVSFSLSFPLQWDQAHRQDRELAAKLAMAEQMRAEREEASRAHLAETISMHQEWQGNRERLRRYDETLVPLAAERARAAMAAYRGGAGMLTALLEARRTEIDMRMERLRLEMDTARLWAQLNYLIPAGHTGLPR